MPRDGAITFRDIVGKLAVLRITCDKCGRSGQYRVDRLIVRYGIDAKLFDWSDEITADCPRKQAKNLSDMCGARCPDLSKVVSRPSPAGLWRARGRVNSLWLPPLGAIC
jgi:hypothetical protein